jgi:DNA modification methylase
MATYHKIIIGDSRRMQELRPESVHLIITSPPYWQLKDYGNRSQIGFNDSYEDYINNLNLVWNECHRVLHKGCRLCINIGDQFARSVYYGRYKVIPIRTEIIRFCETKGFDYMGAIIWQKVTSCNTTGGATIMGSFPCPRNGILKLDYEFILIFKKGGKGPKVSKAIKDGSKMTIEEWNQYFAGHWNFSGEKQDKHLAMFPEELPKRLIKMFSFVGDTILDPFLGSGTTCLAARNLGRNSIGYEINEEFLPIIEIKIGAKNKTLFSDVAFEIIRGKNEKTSFEKKLSELPYIFKDPVSFDKKLDPKKLRFGSKIDSNQHTREDYYRVKKIITPTTLILDDSLKVRLLGVKEKKCNRSKAIEFLAQKTKGQRVFMKFDRQKFDKDNNLFCYLYLENKTFLNSHLVKQGFANVDTSVDFRCKEEFFTSSQLQTEKRRLSIIPR